MSEDQLKAFIKMIAADTELQENLKAATSPEAIIEIAKAAGISITTVDIQSIKSESEEVELTDDELAGVAGGAFMTGLSPELQALMRDAQGPTAGPPSQRDPWLKDPSW